MMCLENLSSEVAKNRLDRRERVSVISERIRFLSGRDRAMMSMYLFNQASVGQLAQLLGINEGNVARRLRRISNRLIRCKYVVCLENRGEFTGEEMAIAKDYFVKGTSMREIADRYGLSYYGARKSVQQIKWRVKQLESKIKYQK